MKILVLIAGVQDPKWPVTPEAVRAGSASDRRIMSPFDEAALEMALRIRDARPESEIAVRVGGGGSCIRLARTIAAFNIPDIGTIALDRDWDQSAVAHAIAPLAGDTDLILLGREFGDFDDGLVPPLLAGLLGLPFFGRAQTVETANAIGMMRETGLFSETLSLAGRVVVSVTNDRRTRLRKPLMKNVMQARHAEVGEAAALPVPTAALELSALVPASAGRDRTECVMITGTLAEQANSIAAMLWEARA